MASEQRRLSTLLGHLKTKPPSTGSYGAAAVTGQAGGFPKRDGFRYTLDGGSEGVLSKEQRQFYEENGYLVVKGLVAQHHLDTYRERFRQICSREVEVIKLIYVLRFFNLGSLWKTGTCKLPGSKFMTVFLSSKRDFTLLRDTKTSP
jgi:hypothetical protein